MDFNTYQLRARETAIYPNIGKNFEYPTIGLFSECGEAANKIKKIIRDDKGVITEQKRIEIKDELGDVLWYLANLCAEFSIYFDDVAQENLEKLHRRRMGGKISGSGDNR